MQAVTKDIARDSIPRLLSQLGSIKARARALSVEAAELEIREGLIARQLAALKIDFPKEFPEEKT